MTAEHSRLLPASGAPSWGNCSGSALINASTPDIETDASREGTAAHWACSTVLDGFKGDGPLSADRLVGQAAPNGVVVDAGMAECAQVFIDDVLSACQRHGGLQSLLVEHRVHMPQIDEENWGTLDAALPVLDGTYPVIYLWDYKHGHRDNRAAYNLQLIDYMAGLVAELKINGQDEQRIKFVMRIVQPRCYHGDGPINEWTGTLSDLRAHWNQLADKAAEITTGQVAMSTGIWCRDCPAVGRCPTARKAAYSLIDYVDEPYAIDSMSGADLASERAILSRGMATGEARLAAIEDDLIHRVKRGDTDTGLVVEAKQGRQAWDIPHGQIVALAAQFGADANKPATYTPAQVEAKVDKAMRPAFKQLALGVTMRPAGKLALVSATDNSVGVAFKTEQK